ncbi:TetR/AcrR family transcriptional regulator [Paenibacillus sp.]|uniref:TetR/AcrR family transcriptional regulator n=1 Tax=Paenibacillus sp. TaxID=58172 RepID=UPI002D6B5B0D|nr:TetR/AcrR family transcriptional regulator [Paenibacillus sp.]HZG56696.1 TetR/AcrR family transcriptional regulator [Paenibacillus sp.]
MKPSSESHKSYTSELRKRQKEQTRLAILNAAASLVAEGNLPHFSVQEVATRAGISYGAVYKHFPSREALLEGLYEWGQAKFSKSFPLSPASLDELAQGQRAYAEESDEGFDTAAAVIRALTALQIVPRGMQSRDEAMLELLRKELPGLDPAFARRAAAAMRLLSSSNAWVTLRTRFGLSNEETGETLAWALEALVRDARTKHGTTDA